MLKTYRLVTNDGETIKTVETVEKFEAIIFFSEVKRLSVGDLLKIFSIECD